MERNLLKFIFILKQVLFLQSNLIFTHTDFPSLFIQSPVSTVKGGCPLLGNLPPSRYPISLLVVTIQNTAQILHPMAVFFPTHSANHIVKGVLGEPSASSRAALGSCPSLLGRKKQLNKHGEIQNWGFRICLSILCLYWAFLLAISDNLNLSFIFITDLLLM